MCSAKPKSLFPGRLFSESEKGCQVKIGNETEYVTYAVGYVDIDDLLEYNIYSIVQGGSKEDVYKRQYFSSYTDLPRLFLSNLFALVI